MAFSTATFIQGTGCNYLLQSTSTAAAGNWVPVHPAIRNLSFQLIGNGSSATASVSGQVDIQGSLDGLSATTQALVSLTLSSGSSPMSAVGSIDAHYNFVRAQLAAATTNSSGSTFSVLVSALDPR